MAPKYFLSRDIFFILLNSSGSSAKILSLGIKKILAFGKRPKYFPPRLVFIFLIKPSLLIKLFPLISIFSTCKYGILKKATTPAKTAAKITPTTIAFKISLFLRNFLDEAKKSFRAIKARLRNLFFPDIFSQNFRHQDGAVGLLKIFHHRNYYARSRNGGAIERVSKS